MLAFLLPCDDPSEGLCLSLSCLFLTSVGYFVGRFDLLMTKLFEGLRVTGLGLLGAQVWISLGWL